MDWLKRFENGETYKEIGDKDGFDERTVKKYINKIREHKETIQARTMVYKEALEKHFKDLTALARRLDQLVMAGKSVTAEQKDPPFRALAEHLPKSKLWANLSKWENFFTEIEAARERFQGAIKNEILADKTLKSAYGSGMMDADNLSKALVLVADSLLHGYKGIRAEDSLNPEPTDNPELVVGRFGGFNIGTLPPERLPALVTAVSAIENRLTTFKEFTALKEMLERKQVVKEEAHAILTTIVLKRVVSGRCAYCPF
ncbi:hypothetical protein DD509_06945 [Dehalogenimonas alkenigignens]|nr:hypothetical protein DD509_06945 [Dehalogenimonas alkenigignens]